MNRLPWRYEALIAANLAIAIAGILLRPIYPKSIFIAMFVMAILLVGFSARMVLLARKEPSDRNILLIGALMSFGASAFVIYLTLRSILL